MVNELSSLVVDPKWSSVLAGASIASILLLFIFMFLIVIGIYIYISLAYSKIAKKAKFKSPGLAWIPFVGPSLIACKIAKMHWWPILLAIGLFIPYLSLGFAIALSIFSVIWHWHVFEYFKKPGWIAILFLIPFVGSLIMLIMIGIIAWEK
ncbi:MAG: hypothetical protein AABY10_02315 [Nanoarchaeota archaeon]